MISESGFKVKYNFTNCISRAIEISVKLLEREKVTKMEVLRVQELIQIYLKKWFFGISRNIYSHTSPLNIFNIVYQSRKEVLMFLSDLIKFTVRIDKEKNYDFIFEFLELLLSKTSTLVSTSDY